ncbi:MAG: thermonuclease family protein, partial [Candidatus Caldarchaeum sp.]
DINTPERNEPGYNEAKEALRRLVEGKKVFLDVDNVNVMDSYQRLVAVVYVQHNSTHVLNVNLWLVTNGYAMFRDFNNEFNPYTWSLYLPFS